MRKSILLAAAAIPMMAACTNSPYVDAEPPIYQLGETSKITGTLGYRERIALPAGSIATVMLEDISRADAGATVIDEVRYDLTGTVIPFMFELELPNKGIQSNARYAVRAKINAPDGTLLFTTDTVNPVMARPVDQDLGDITMVNARR